MRKPNCLGYYRPLSHKRKVKSQYIAFNCGLLGTGCDVMLILLLGFFLCKNKKRTLVATASRIVRPNTIYRVNVVVLPDSPDLIVKAFITKGSGYQIASAVEIIDSGTSRNLLMKVFRLY